MIPGAMTLNDFLFKNFFREIEHLTQTCNNNTVYIQAQGRARSADIYEYYHPEEKVYIYKIYDLDGKREETIVTSSKQFEGMQNYIVNFASLTSGVEGSYIAYVKKLNDPETIAFRLTNSDMEAIQGKVTRRQNQSSYPKEVINIFQDVAVTHSNHVDKIIIDQIAFYKAIKNTSIFLANINSNNVMISPDLAKDLEALYLRHETEILESITRTPFSRNNLYK